jgi:tetratricopeptide (TPR) repeat protein
MAGAESCPLGKAALRSGDYARARQYFESAIEDRTDGEQSQAGLLEALRETGAFQEAAKRAEGFLSARDGSALLHLERARIAGAVGDYAGAERHLRRCLALAPGGSAARMDATRVLAELLEEIGRRAEARRLWDQLIEAYRGGRVQGSQRLGDVAVAAWRRGYIEDAKDIFLDATDPKLGDVSLETLADFGYLFLEKYNVTDALGVFRDCLKINKSYPEALVGIALAKRYDSDLEAESYGRAALKVNPNLIPALNSLAELAMEEENHEAALEKIRAALAINPANLESLSLEAVYCYLRGDASGFAEIEKRILGINPSYGRFYYTLAENLVSRRKYQEAVDFNRKAIALDPELWSAYASLGMNLTRTGDLEEGRKAIQKAFDGDPFNVWAFNSLELFDQMDTFARGQSEHFRFRMSKEDEPVLSSYASELAEEAYAALTRRYGFRPEGPLQIEIFPDHGGFAVRTLGLPGLGGAVGVCFGKVVALDSPRARKAGTFNWGTTLWHEFTHVITLQMTHYNIPRWYSEGLSGYEEHRARPGWGDNLTLSFLRGYKEGKLLKASALNSGIMRPQNPEQIALSYYQAALVCEWIEEKYGFDKIRQSLLLFSENKPAEEVFRQALGLDPAGMDAEYARFIDARVQGIAAHVNLARPEGASKGEAAARPDKNALAERLKRNSEDFLANLQMGTVLHKEGADSEAEIYLKKAQRLFPQYAEPGNPYQLLGPMYLETKREAEALAEFIAWSHMDCSAREPLMKAAEIYRSRKDWALAAGMLKLSAYINPYDPAMQKELGEAAMESREWALAIASYRVLVSLNASDPAGAHYDLARALLASGKRQEARRETLRALELAPSFAKAQELLLELSGKAGE